MRARVSMCVRMVVAGGWCRSLSVCGGGDVGVCECGCVSVCGGGGVDVGMSGGVYLSVCGGCEGAKLTSFGGTVCHHYILSCIFTVPVTHIGKYTSSPSSFPPPLLSLI